MTSTSAENLERVPQIPGFRIVRRLGRGGMAEVFLAVQLSLQRQVALKILPFDEDTSDDLAERFEREARTIARLDHPQIVGIHEVGRTRDGSLYYTMPYLSNGDLASRPLSDDPRAMIRVLRAICDALEYAHAHGVVHRDVKPENILFDKTDRPLLTDFGIALSRDENHRVTHRGRTLGSSGYMSPEQARGQELDGRADLYSLGVVCYEMLTHGLPYSGPDALAMAIAHTEDPIPRLPQNQRLWQGFVDKAIAKSPADRFQTAAEMRAALDVLESRLQRELPPPPAAATAAAPRTINTLPFRRTLAIALLALAAVMLWRVVPTLWQSTPDPARRAATPVAALDTKAMDKALREGHALLKAGKLFDTGGNGAADRFISLLRLQPTNAEARSGLDAVLEASATQSAKAIANGDGMRADALYESSSAATQAAGIPNYPAWTKYEQRYLAAVNTALDTAAQRLDGSALTRLAPALDNAELNHPEIVQRREQFAKLPKAGARVRDAQGPNLVIVPPTHSGATIDHAFALGLDEVTRAEYAGFARATGRAAAKCRDGGGPLSLFRRRDWTDPGFEQGASEPVVCVSHADARAYADWLSKKTGARYRLPSIGEWRHATRDLASNATPCRSGNVFDRSTEGRLNLVDRYDCSDGVVRTASVGKFAPSALGFHDLIGNVREWLSDCAQNSSNGGCAERAIAGSSYRDGAKAQLLGTSDGSDPDVGTPWIGFRVARDVDLNSIPPS